MAAIATAETAGADAGTRPVVVQFDGPEGCSGADAFLSNLRSRTDRVRRALADEPHTIVQVRLSRGHGQVAGELRMIDDRGETDTRKVQGASCDEVVQALSLTAALALDPGALLLVPSAAPGTDAAATDGAAKPAVVRTAQEEAASPAAVTAAQTPSAWPSRPVPDIELGAGLVGFALLTGSFSPGIGVAVRKNLGRDDSRDRTFRPTLGLALAYLRNDVWHSPRDAEVALAAMGATVCPLRGTASILTVQPCVHVLAGWLSASGRQVTHVSTVDRSWFSAGLTVRTAAFLGRGFSLELEGGISAPLVKRRFFATTPSNVVAETPTISPIVGVGLTYAW